ncbi:MAG: hypothetical protein LBV29_09125 [Azoarcus sp.]|jgi:hypothetical protein|nr:hypothetical protein [Azoarcus sp.]
MKNHALHVSAVCLAALLAWHDAAALGANSSEPPPAETKADDAKSKAPRAKAAKPKPAAPASQQAACAPRARTEHFEPGQAYRLQTRRGYVTEIRLTPGDALLLSTLTQDTGSANKSGVGSPNNPVFGGGFANVRGQVLTGIVITVRIL